MHKTARANPTVSTRFHLLNSQLELGNSFLSLNRSGLAYESSISRASASRSSRTSVFIFTKNLKRPTGPRGTETLFTAAANVVVAPGKANKAILDALLRGGGRRFDGVDALGFRDPGNLDFRLKPGSPLIDAGVKIPGFNDAARGAPDVGPFETDGDGGPDWPRPRKTVFNDTEPEAVKTAAANDKR